MIVVVMMLLVTYGDHHMTVFTSEFLAHFQRGNKFLCQSKIVMSERKPRSEELKKMPLNN